MTDLPVDADHPPTHKRDEDHAEGLREHLKSEATNLVTQLESLDGLDHGIEAATFDDNFADSGQVAAEMGENRALAAQLREQLDDVERALAKLDEGTYGTCEICGATIGAARIEAMPATRFCIEHAG